MEKEKSTKKSSIGTKLAWGFGSLFAFVGIFTLLTDPIEAILFLIMSAVLLPPVTELITNKLKFKVSKPIKIIVIIICLIIIGAMTDASNNYNENTQNVSNNTEVEEVVSNEDVEPGNEEINNQNGINVSRYKIIGVFEKDELGFDFEKGAPIDGQDNYVATKGSVVMQLVGPSDNLKEASAIALLSNDVGENMISLATVIGFANIIDENSIDWVGQEFEKISKNPTEDYNNSRIFNDKMFEVIFMSTDAFNSFTLVVSPLN